MLRIEHVLHAYACSCLRLRYALRMLTNTTLRSSLGLRTKREYRRVLHIVGIRCTAACGRRAVHTAAGTHAPSESVKRKSGSLPGPRKGNSDHRDRRANGGSEGRYQGPGCKIPYSIDHRCLRSNVPPSHQGRRARRCSLYCGPTVHSFRNMCMRVHVG